jgi:hypothetical protein
MILFQLRLDGHVQSVAASGKEFASPGLLTVLRNNNQNTILPPNKHIAPARTP